MRLIAVTLIAVTCFCNLVQSSTAAEPVSLMGMISQWQYPISKMQGAEMADAATVDGSGNRTVGSLICKTTMTTNDSVEKIVAFYHDKLTPDEGSEDREKSERKEGRSVIFSDDAQGRPFALHTILVNTPTTSTTLIITRGKDEAETHITWKHYMVR